MESIKSKLVEKEIKSENSKDLNKSRIEKNIKYKNYKIGNFTYIESTLIDDLVPENERKNFFKDINNFADHKKDNANNTCIPKISNNIAYFDYNYNSNISS